MRFARALAVVAAAGVLCAGGGERAAGAPPAATDAAREGETRKKSPRDSGKPAGQVIPAVAAWEDGFPVPAGARRNDSLSGATSLAPGKNYTVRVYDTDAGMEATNEFYLYHLPEAKRVAEGQEVKFATPRGQVRLARQQKGTRITFAIGPR